MDEKPVKRERKIPKKISKTYLENSALYYLQRYATSSENLRRVMMRKVKRSCAHHQVEIDPFIPMVDDLVARYQSVGLVNDDVFAHARVTSLRRQGLSSQAIYVKLQVKGLSKKHIEAALATVDAEQEDPETTAALAYIKRKKLGRYRTKALRDHIKDAQKELASMARAGFSFEVARLALQIKDED